MATSIGVIAALLLVWCIFGDISCKNVDTRFRRQAETCDNVMPFFQSKNITIEKINEKGKICSGYCCDSATELLLKEQGRKDFAMLLRHNSRSLLGPINRTAAVLQNHVWELANQSENKTLLLFSQVYRTMSVLARDTIELLYRDIRDYVKIDPSNPSEKSPGDIEKTVDKFFTDLFPLAYHQQTGGKPSGDFTDKYKLCLKENMDVIEPFGEFPKEVTQSLSKSLEATRLLLQAFHTGIEVLNTTDALILEEKSSTSSECHSAILKMTYCPKCMGLTKNSKPCSGYCLNVLRGCISKYQTELELPWNSYVEGIERLVDAMKRTSNDAGINIDVAIRNLDGQISSAIMYCMEKIVDIDKKVKKSCKIPEFLQRVDSLSIESSTLATAIAKSRQPSSRSFPHFPDAHMTSFLSTMSKTKGFYAELANNVCGDESFAEQGESKKCWNGERIAEYSKTVVGSAANMQIYNPEVKTSPNQPVDPRVSTLVDKLQHVHRMAVKSLGPNYSDTDYMQRDGVDGSGSGNGPDFDDEDDPRGSGSGTGPIDDDEKPETRVHYNTNGDTRILHEQTPTVHRASSSPCLSPTVITLILAVTVFVSSRN